jgi:hypothetical protein
MRSFRSIERMPGGLEMSSEHKPKNRNLTLEEVNAFLEGRNPLGDSVASHRFSIGTFLGGRLAGIVVVDYPSSSFRDDGLTLEVTRICTEGADEIRSFLYRSAARAAFATGARRIGVYASRESTLILRAAGFKLRDLLGEGDWDREVFPGESPDKPAANWFWEMYANASKGVEIRSDHE